MTGLRRGTDWRDANSSSVMNEKPLFVLISVMEDALMDLWTFRATDKLQVARYLEICTVEEPPWGSQRQSSSSLNKA